ncbi:MAG: thermonuclease family protein [Candidatus Omnitrophica bacterium]|nr:thermonuclease family protein [Candidatus Omnitrophota bacterium]
MRTLILTLVASLFITSHAYGEVSRWEFDIQDKGCNVLNKIARGELTFGELQADQRIAINYLKQQNWRRYDSCLNLPKTLSTQSEEVSNPETLEETPAVLDKTDWDYPYQAKIIQIVDGSTFKLSTGQTAELIGVKLLSDHDRGAIRRYLENILLNNEVRLEYDKERKTRYGSLLVYLFLKNRTFVNRLLIDQGFAEPNITDPNNRYQNELLGIAEEKSDGGFTVEERRFLAQQKMIKQALYIVIGFFVLFLMLVFLARLRHPQKTKNGQL